jgi:hypothetical protein
MGQTRNLKEKLINYRQKDILQSPDSLANEINQSLLMKTNQKEHNIQMIYAPSPMIHRKNKKRRTRKD